MQTDGMIRYEGRELIKKLINGDKRSPLGDTAYMLRMRSRLFWQSLWIFLALLLAQFFVVQPLMEQLLFQIVIAHGGGVFAGVAVLSVLLEQVLRAAIIWSLVNGAVVGWREKTMADTVLAGNSLESLAYFPSRSLLGAFFWSVMLASPVNVAFNSQMAGQGGGQLVGALVGMLFISFFVAHFFAFVAWMSIFLTITSAGFSTYLTRWIGWGLKALFLPLCLFGLGVYGFSYLLNTSGMFQVVQGPLGTQFVPTGSSDGSLLMLLLTLYMLIICPWMSFKWMYRLAGQTLVRLRAHEATIADGLAASGA